MKRGAFPVIVVLVGFCAAGAQEPQPPDTQQPAPTFRTRVDLVRVDVTVIGRGNEGAIADLKAAQQSGDFEAQGRALKALDDAVKAYQAATAAANAPGAGSPSPNPGG